MTRRAVEHAPRPRVISHVVETDQWLAQMGHLEGELGLLDGKVTTGEVPSAEKLDSQVQAMLPSHGKADVDLLAAVVEWCDHDPVIPGQGADGRVVTDPSSEEICDLVGEALGRVPRPGSTFDIGRREGTRPPECLPTARTRLDPEYPRFGCGLKLSRLMRARSRSSARRAQSSS